MSQNPYAYCPFCLRERQTTGGGAMKGHNMWDDRKKKMVTCPGSGMRPGRVTPLRSA